MNLTKKKKKRRRYYFITKDIMNRMKMEIESNMSNNFILVSFISVLNRDKEECALNGHSLKKILASQPIKLLPKLIIHSPSNHKNLFHFSSLSFPKNFHHTISYLELITLF